MWEELGIDVQAHTPLIRINHRYPDLSVLLDVHRITKFSGVAKGLEGQPLAWVSAESMLGYPMPAADRSIVSALRLPDRYLITGSGFDTMDDFVRHFEKKLAEGQRLIQLRAPDLEPGLFQQLARRLVALCRDASARLLLNSTPDEAAVCEADGVHLTSQQLMSFNSRPLPAEKWVAASCHNAKELQHAEHIGVDFAVLSPVLATVSHPGQQPIGWWRFQELVEQVNIPVYALGGMSPSLIHKARECGGQGIAAIRALWQ